jgi:hypothetical protein
MFRILAGFIAALVLCGSAQAQRQLQEALRRLVRMSVFAPENAQFPKLTATKVRH